MEIKIFTFNDFYENTYILYDKTGECAIIDPGCNTYEEKSKLKNFIAEKSLSPVLLLNTHCHIDHILGNRFISDTYQLALGSHEGEMPVLASGATVAMMYGIYYEPSPDISIFYKEGDLITFGETTLEVLFTPGHSPASISFYNRENKIIFGGDVLFEGSIGRTDLPGGDHKTLLNSIKNKFFTLEDDVKVYAGHGNATSIGIEKRTNPFF